VKKREQELAEMEKEQQAMEKEREKLGVMWGMGKWVIEMEHYVVLRGWSSWILVFCVQYR